MKLYNDLEIPNIAFGTGVIKRFYRKKTLYYKDKIKALLVSIKHLKIVRRLKNDLGIKKILNYAIELGYNFIDTGRLYGHSEKYIGDVIKNYERDRFFIVSKVSDVDLCRYDYATSVKTNLDISLRNLGTNYLDAYLLHFPQGDWIQLYHEMEQEYLAGKVKAIGVCNFDIEELEKLKQNSAIKPMICQVEIHPLNVKNELLNYCKKENIVVMAHTPTGHMDKRITQSIIMQELSRKYNKSIAQIIYKWHLQKDVIPIISTVSINHLRNNLLINDFELQEEEIKRIDSLNENYSFDLNNNKMNDCPDFIYNI